GAGKGPDGAGGGRTGREGTGPPAGSGHHPSDNLLVRIACRHAPVRPASRRSGKHGPAARGLLPPGRQAGGRSGAMVPTREQSRPEETREQSRPEETRGRVERGPNGVTG